MPLLQNLSPGQRQAVIFGGPVVAAFALISVLQKRNQGTPTTTPTTGGTGALLAPSTDAIGTGQLADFESTVTGAITQLANQIALLDSPSTVETPTPTTTVIYQTVAAPAAPSTTAQPAPSSVPLSFWQAQPWYGKQVDAGDPNVPSWYKMGFMAPRFEGDT